MSRRAASLALLLALNLAAGNLVLLATHARHETAGGKLLVHAVFSGIAATLLPLTWVAAGRKRRPGPVLVTSFLAAFAVPALSIRLLFLIAAPGVKAGAVGAPLGLMMAAFLAPFWLTFGVVNAVILLWGVKEPQADGSPRRA
ncbi:hypothetical protein FBQ97_08220 [Acidobacteria bacterium ACD]|nr:MAG: hypothetical protein EDX89_00910 [Acidobacteriota bacterium]MCE7959684.1 hypothetical protein [Acidobacteria bacterium ACB2]MDL1949780.1 hypothetical protein [Acidobacteria bacterium ACD]